MSHLHHLDFYHWLNFGLAVLIVFSIWWIFFTLISDRKCKSGFNNISFMQIIYIPKLMSLGMIGAGFSSVFEYFEHPNMVFTWLFTAFRIALGMCCIISFLQYPKQYMKITRFSQLTLFLVSLLFFSLLFLKLKVDLSGYLLIVLLVIQTLILAMNIWWYTTSRKLSEQGGQVEK